jgi:hypothetical protein
LPPFQMANLKERKTMGIQSPEFRLTIEFDNQQQAYFLALFLKRLTWSDMEGCAASKEETYKIREAVEVVQRDLAANGFAPR